MPKAKKVEAEVVEEVVEECECTEFTPKVIAPLTSDFGREDLNELRDRLNEVISALNQ